MEASDFPSPRRAAQDLSHSVAFALGPLAVDPPSRRVSAGERSQMLEPKVMRVLVAFGEAGGKVLSRDDLIEQCWDGVVVGDNAINQVISRLRHVFADLTGEAVRLETITKVGFRLVVDGQVGGAATNGSDGPVWRRPWTRRAVAAGLAVAGAGTALAYATWFRPRRHTPDPRAAELFRRGQAIEMDGEYERMGEATEAYKQAAEIDPRYADAWGALALSYRYPVLGPTVRLSDPREVRDAAGRALALDPDNADAQLSLIALYPTYRRWQEYEAELRAFLGDLPDSALGHALLSGLLLDVGRLEEALSAARRVIKLEPRQLLGWQMQAFSLLNAGRFHEADFAFEEARSRWPEQARLWLGGSVILANSNRYAEAVTYLRDTSRRPQAVSVALVEAVIRQYEALATGRGLDALRETARTSPAAGQFENIQIAAPMLVELGMTDEAFGLMEVFYFGGVFNGTRFAPPGPLDPRDTGFLFAYNLRSLRSDPRFASLLERTGLEDYWRKAGIQPDFRR